MNITEVRKIVGKIKASLFKNANSTSIGMLKTNFKGTGLQFKEHQVYTFGDDIRFIDWKILAKTSNPYVKTFNEERNVEIVVVLDASSTMIMGYKGITKLQAAIEICCLLYLLAKETNDFVHVVVVSDEIINIPKKSGEEGITYLISTLEKMNILINGKVNHEIMSREISHGKEKQIAIMKHLSRKREIVLLSDFNEFLDPDVLKKMLFRSNVHGFQILAPIDETDKIPYSLFAKDSVSKKSTLAQYNFAGQNKLVQIMGKKIKKIRIKEKYLENFVKEMS